MDTNWNTNWILVIHIFQIKILKEESFSIQYVFTLDIPASMNLDSMMLVVFSFANSVIASIAINIMKW